MAQDNEVYIDYVALAEQLIEKPRWQRRLIRKWVRTMADDKKRNTAGTIIVLLIAGLTVGAAFIFDVPPAAFVSILVGGALLMLFVWAVFHRML